MNVLLSTRRGHAAQPRPRPHVRARPEHHDAPGAPGEVAHDDAVVASMRSGVLRAAARGHARRASPRHLAATKASRRRRGTSDSASTSERTRASARQRSETTRTDAPRSQDTTGMGQRVTGQAATNATSHDLAGLTHAARDLVATRPPFDSGQRMPRAAACAQVELRRSHGLDLCGTGLPAPVKSRTSCIRCRVPCRRAGEWRRPATREHAVIFKSACGRPRFSVMASVGLPAAIVPSRSRRASPATVGLSYYALSGRALPVSSSSCWSCGRR